MSAGSFPFYEQFVLWIKNMKLFTD